MSAPIRCRKTRGATFRPWLVSFGGATAAFPTGADALDFIRRLIRSAS